MNNSGSPSIWPLFATLLLAACAKPPSAPPPPPPPPPPEYEQQWTLRADPAALQDALLLTEAALADDDVSDLRPLLARLTRGQAFAAHQASDPTAKRSGFRAAVSWGQQCLDENPEYAALLQKERETPATAARTFTDADVPCVFWTAVALDAWCRASGLSTRLKHQPTIDAYLSRVEVLRPAFFYAGPDRQLAVRLATLPAGAGQNLDEAFMRLRRAIEGSPQFLENHLYLARYWAVPAGRPDVFSDSLRTVLNADVDAHPEIRAENLAAQAQARQLLSEQGVLFSTAEP